MAPPRPLKELLFCPRQDRIEEMAVYLWYFSKGLIPYLNILDDLKKRQIQLSPFTVLGAKGVIVPVTPLRNPKTNMSSHFIIRMIDEEDLKYMVDCLVRDTDLYFVGFRRHLQLTAEEEMLEKREEREWKAASSQKQNKKKRKGQVIVGRKSGWGSWYEFENEDMAVPAFLKATKLNISAAYIGPNCIRPGGIPAIRKMFLAFAEQEDGVVSKTAIVEACYCFMSTINEPSRVLSSKNEVSRRVALNEYPAPVTDKIWNSIHTWGRKGRVVLNYRLNDHLEPHLRLPTWLEDLGLVQMRELIGEKGELLLIKHDRALMGIPDHELLEIEDAAREMNAGPADRMDPGLNQPHVDWWR